MLSISKRRVLITNAIQREDGYEYYINFNGDLVISKIEGKINQRNLQKARNHFIDNARFQW